MYSHGSGLDLGWVMPFMIRLSSQLGVDVFMIEYNGYGPFQEIHNYKLDQDLETIKVYEACYDYLANDLQINP